MKNARRVIRDALSNVTNCILRPMGVNILKEYV